MAGSRPLGIGPATQRRRPPSVGGVPEQHADAMAAAVAAQEAAAEAAAAEAEGGEEAVDEEEAEAAV